MFLLEFCTSLLSFTDPFEDLVGNLVRMHNGAGVRRTCLGRQIKIV